MKNWKTHLAWAVATPVFAFSWGRWCVARQEPQVVVRERAAEVREEPPRNRPDPAPAPKTLSPAPPAFLRADMPDDDQGYVDSIRRLFRSNDKKDCWEAARRLRRIPAGPLMNELLYDELACKDANLRYSAISSLGEALKADSVPLMLSLLKTESDGPSRRMAAEYLEKFGGPAAIEGLLQAVHDPESYVRLAAAAALNRLGQPGPAEALVPGIAAGLDSPDGGIRRDALYDLIRLHLPSVTPILVRCLRDPDGDVRKDASHGLGASADPRVLPILESLLKDADPKVAEAAETAISIYKATQSRK